MFRTTDTITKKGIVYKPGQRFFKDKERKIAFHQIEEFYVDSTSHHCNMVFEGHEYIIQLKLKGEEEPYTMEAISNVTEAYKTLDALHDGIEEYMNNKLTQAFMDGEEVLFPTIDKDYLIRVGPGGIHAEKLGRKPWKFKVQSIYKTRDKAGFKFVGADRKTTLYIAGISNAWLLIELAWKKKMSVWEEPRSKVKERFILGGLILVAVLGLNGWFDFVYWNEAFETVCIFSGMFLGLMIFMIPVTFITDKLNARTRRKQAEKLKNCK